MNAMQRAFEAAGLKPEDVVFDKAIALYLNSGGTIARAYARLDVAAAKMPGVDQSANAPESQVCRVQPRQPVEGGEAHDPVSQGLKLNAPSPSPIREPAVEGMPQGQGSAAVTREPQADGGGQDPNAHKGQPSFASPVREPTPQQRTAAASVAKVLAITVLDTLKIDGRAIGDWTVGEARAAGKLKTYEGAILIEASRLVANAPSNALIRNVVKPAELQRIMQKSAEVADAF